MTTAIYADIWCTSEKPEILLARDGQKTGAGECTIFRLPVEISSWITDWSIGDWHAAIGDARDRLGLTCETYCLTIGHAPPETIDDKWVVWRVLDGEIQEVDHPLTSPRVVRRIYSEIQWRKDRPVVEGIGPYKHSQAEDIIRIVKTEPEAAE